MDQVWRLKYFDSSVSKSTIIFNRQHLNNNDMNDSDILIRCDNVGKTFCRDLKKSLWYGVQDVASDFFRLNKRNGQPIESSNQASSSTSDSIRPGEFWAVNGVSFELKRGECLGLIGRNGAGKTTILKMLNGLIKPDRGRIEIQGRVGALIALGAGFNPILTGRENVYVNGSILGLAKKEINDKFDEIVDFAQLNEFIDAPVQSYSSGMQVRLGFAIATVLICPDVLLLDEVLAVGDASFRHKCYSRINKLMSRSAVILVSHDMGYIGQCATSVAMMNRGQATLYHDTIEGINAYNEANTDSGTEPDDDGSVEAVYAPIRSTKVNIMTPEVLYGGRLSVEVLIESETEISNAILSFVALNMNEQPVMAWHTSRNSRTIHLREGRQRIQFNIDPLLLHDGMYRYNFSISRPSSIEHLVWFMGCGGFIVTSDMQPIGNIPYLADTSDYDISMLPQNLQTN